MGRMAFVPEGQADRSQARSAWTAVWTFRGGEEGVTIIAYQVARNRLQSTTSIKRDCTIRIDDPCPSERILIGGFA
jgi:hypothetical protein